MAIDQSKGIFEQFMNPSPRKHDKHLLFSLSGFTVSIEPWLDLALTLAIALLLTNQITSANIILFIWLLIRLTLFSNRPSPQNWILVALALVNCSTIVLDRGGKPSDPSDVLVIGLAFAAGLQRSQTQWRRSMAVIATGLIPVTFTALHNSTGTILQLPGINVNRLSFLLGLLAISGYAACRWAETRIAQLSLAAFTTLSIPLALLTGSRAALAAPALSIAAAWLICKHRQQRTVPQRQLNRSAFSAVAIATLLSASLATAYLWYSNPKDSTENRVNDIKRFETGACWFMAPIRKEQAFSGLGFNGKVRSRCDGNNIPYMKKMDHDKGLPHAHNIAGQIMGETGIPGLAALLAAIVLAAHALKKQLKSINTNSTSLAHATLPLCIYLATTGITTSFYIFLMLNQILIGYMLGALTGLPVKARSQDQFSATESDPAAAA